MTAPTPSQALASLVSLALDYVPREVAPDAYRARVASLQATLAAARKAAGPGYVVRVGALRKGDEWLRVYEETYPVAG
jgi:hypothetical protein